MITMTERLDVEREARRIAMLADMAVQRLRGQLAAATLKGHTLRARRLAEDLQAAELAVEQSRARHAQVLARLEQDA